MRERSGTRRLLGLGLLALVAGCVAAAPSLVPLALEDRPEGSVPAEAPPVGAPAAGEPAAVDPIPDAAPVPAPTLRDRPSRRPRPRPDRPAPVALPPPVVAPATAEPEPPAPLRVGEAAVAVEELTCEPGTSAWLLLVEGPIERAEGGTVALRARRRIGLRYWPAAEGVDETDWFCAPRRRFCYAEVRFGDWRGTIRPLDLVERASGEAFPAALGLPLGVAPVIKARCGL